MSTITSLGASDNGTTSRSTINTNFSNLNTDKLEKDGSVALNNNTNFNIKDSGGTSRNALKMTGSDVLTLGGTNNTTKIRGGSSTTDGHTVPNVADDTFALLGATQTITGNKNFSGTNTHSGAETFTGNVIAKLFAPQGFLINGKISPTVSSNNLTIALKTLAGTDPSSTDPVYVRIGDTVRAITSALSVTKNAGTNWCNSGAAETAAKAIDYFVYLGYNATDGVTIGFSRWPNATQYGDFSTTTTNEKYCAISTITNAASTDYYEVIGRFEATLSAGAGYTWTVPTFTAVNLIQRPVRETRWLTWIPTYTGFSANPTASQRYRLQQSTLFIIYSDAGTSNSATFDFTLPFTITNFLLIPMHMLNNGAGVDTGVIGIAAGGASATAKCGLTQSTRSANAFGGFTTSGSKGFDGSFFLEIS